MLAIYATLGSSRRLAEGLREHTQRRPAIAVTAVYLFTIFRMQIPEERAHLIEYGLVAILIRQALAERRRNGGWAQTGRVDPVTFSRLQKLGKPGR